MSGQIESRSGVHRDFIRQQGRQAGWWWLHAGHCSEHKMHSIQWPNVPKDFTLGVVLGPTDSKAPTIAQILAKHANASPSGNNVKATTRVQQDLAKPEE